jgi:hypothetical protein
MTLWELVNYRVSYGLWGQEYAEWNEISNNKEGIDQCATGVGGLDHGEEENKFYNALQ